MDDAIYYVCRYTPLEWLESFGLTCRRLDPAPADFTCADSCAHPNLCGFGKAVVEEVMARGIRRLLLVDCCDVCRRIYDILSTRDMEFLFLMALPHKNGKAETALLSRELGRLSGAFSALTGKRQDEHLLLQAWQSHCQEAPVPGEHLLLTGAHGGSRLLEMIRQRTTLPVLDHTCTGSRVLCPPTSQSALPQAYAHALLCQSRPCMRMQFRQEEDASGASGIICHTVKFCDYYGFQYRLLKESAERPLLKIETDCTVQSSGQLHTRIDAFAETLGGKTNMIQRFDSAPDYVAGIDSGSASTDVVILDRKGAIAGTAILPTGAGAASGAEKALELALQAAHLERSQIGRILTTGYGRETLGQGDASVTEITCHAKGAHYLAPDARTVIDIGGQDSKVIRLDENGHVVNFVMNDKCAAGTGRFLDMMARTMGLSLSEMSRLGLSWKHPVSISSMCTVFAESEVVSLIAQNTDPADIIHGLNMAVAAKTAALVNRLGTEPAFIMTGGVAQNEGVVRALEEKLNAKIEVKKESQLCGALGAALLALEAQ